MPVVLAVRVIIGWVMAITLPFSGHAQTNSPPEKTENSALTSALFYEILVGELSLTQDDPGTAFTLILDAARKTENVQLYSRAVDIALKARSGDGALAAARAWAKAYPQDRKANNNVLQILLAVNQTGETLEPLKKEIALAPEIEHPAIINQIPRLYARVSDKKQAADVVQQALSPYLRQKPTAAAAWTTLGRMRLANQETTAALEAVRQGLAADPQSALPVLLALELTSLKVNEAEPYVVQAIREQDKPELTMAYVRVLIENQRLEQANEQLLILTHDHPQFPEAWLVLGSLQLEMGQDDSAEDSLARYVELALQSDADANARNILQAQSRRAAILARHGKLDQARALVAQTPAHNAEEERSRLLAEVQLLRDMRQWQTAYDLLAQTSNADNDLLYEQAMLAEKLGQHSTMERLLNQIVAQDSTYYSAYNALGFSLADRNQRLAEAKQLIVKALSFAPDDPFIIDSMGWVEFRLGNLTEALSLLQKAYAGRADPEIAAHLGEVLWRLNRQEDAQQIWREGQQAAPDNEILRDTLQRLHPAL